MSDRTTEAPSELEAEGIPDPNDDLNLQPPRDSAIAADDFGTTVEEMRDGEPLDGRLAREEPDVLSAAGTDADESVGQVVGRLVEPDEGGRTDSEPDMVAADVGTDVGGYSAEELAMHVEPEV